MRRWFYLTETRDRVAVPEADFFPLAETGVIRPQTMVWTDGMEDWAAVGEIHPELFGDAALSAPVDLPTVLQMVRSLSAPLGRANPALKSMAVFFSITALAVAVLVGFGTYLAVDQFGPIGWWILAGIPLAVIPALAAVPMFRAANTSRRAHSQLDRGAFYASSNALGRLAWIGAIAAGFVLLLSVASAVLLLVYRVELIEFIKRGIGEA